MIRLLGFIVFFLASTAFADKSLCNNIEDTQKQEACNQDKEKVQETPLAKGMQAYTDKSYEQALQFLLQAANTGKTHAYELLADMYATGQGTTQDFTESVKWHRKAANNGSHNSQFALGNFYLIGKGVKKDERQAFTWFEKAAKGNDKRAYLVLGLMYDKGKGIEKNSEKAFNWFEKSAKAGNASGQYYTGVAYIRSKGITRDIDKGIHWLEKSKKNGHKKTDEILAIAQKMKKLEDTRKSISKDTEQKATTKEIVTVTKTEEKPVEPTRLKEPTAKKVSQKPVTKKTSKQFPRNAKVFAPPSNVRKTPGRQVICSVDTAKTINIGRAINGWYATDACGKKGYIHKSQIRIIR